jgi:hypothetical protein
MSTCRSFIIVLSLLSCGPPTSRLTASPITVEILVYAATGQSPTTTYASPPLVLEFFNGEGVPLPANGLPAGGLTGIERHTIASSGMLTDAGSASGSGDSIFGPWTGAGSATANATFGKVGASATGTRVNVGDNNTIVGFEGAGAFTDSFTINSPSLALGSIGHAVLHWTIDGSLTRTGNSGTTAVDVNYQQNAGPIFSLMRAIVQAGVAPDLVPRSGPGRDGFAVSVDSINGRGVFQTMPLGFVAGSPFDLRLGLLAYALPRDGSATAQFGATALLTGIDVFNGLGQPVTDFTITSGSGTFYDADGVHLVPEPSGLALCAIGCATLFMASAQWRPKKLVYGSKFG